MREQFIARLRQALEPLDIHPVEVRLRQEDADAIVERLEAAALNGRPIFVTGLEAAIPSDNPDTALGYLNHNRNRFERLYRASLQTAEDLISREAFPSVP